MDLTGTGSDLAHIRAELRQILSEVVEADLSAVADDTPLLDYVPSSLALVEGIRRAYDRFGVVISIRRVLEDGANLAALAAYVDQARHALRRSTRAETGRAARSAGDGGRRTVPLAPSQRRTGFLAHYSSDASVAHHEALLMRLEGTLHLPALQAAVRAASDRHLALRTALSEDPNRLELDAAAALELVVSNGSPERLGPRLAEIVQRPFQPADLLFRAELVRLAETTHVLALVGHALVVDQDALLTVMQDVAAGYRAAADGRAIELAPAVQWTEYVARREDESAERAYAAAAYWQAAIVAGLPALDLPADRPRPPIMSYEGARQAVPVEPDLEGRLLAWAEARQTPGFAAVLAAFSVLLHRLGGQPQVVIGTSRRSPAAGERIVAPARTMVPVLSRYDAGRGFAEHVRALAAALDEAHRDRQVSLGGLVHALNPPRDQSRPPLFSAAIAEQPWPAPPAFDPLHASFEMSPSTGARFDVAVTFAPGQGPAQLYCDYSTELFDPCTVRRWLLGLLEILRAGTADDVGEPCGLLPIMPAGERQMLVHQWNATERLLPRGRTTLDLVLEQAGLRAGHAAILWQGQTLSYGELAARSERIAGRLRVQGIRRGDRVGLLLRRSPDLVAAMLAAWRLGALYVPLDPDFPRLRLAFMTRDAEVRSLITSRDLLGLVEWQSPARPLCLDDPAEEIPSGCADAPPAPPGADPSDGAYIIYTSGSTGQPKGVVVGHDGLTNVLLATRELLGFSTGGSMLAIFTASFDASALELFTPLVAGGVLALGEDGLAADGCLLAERIASGKPSHVLGTPSIWEAVLAAGWSGDPDLCILSGGEALGRELAERLLTSGRTVWNLYGPTETTIYSAAYEVVSAPDVPMRIGRPCPNTQLYVLDEQLQPMPIGAAGDLYIGGRGLAQGYWRRPEMTAERFIPNPFREGQRMYRTGDLARTLPGGDVVCLGRLDHQVKVHGVRVELGEVEAALRAIPGVGDAVVSPWIDASGDRRLIAYLLSGGTGDPVPADVRALLRERLSEPMIPSIILLVDRFPLTASGKIDRASLPVPNAVASPALAGATAPATRTERLLAEIWARVLGVDVDRVSREADFKDLGGHSLLMTQLKMAVRREFDVSFSLRELFAAPTLGAFAALLDERRRLPPGVPGHLRPIPARDAEWGRQRMAFLRREAQLPASIAPARGLTFETPSRVRSALLTGATGFLGAHIVAEVLRATDVHLHCLVRRRQGASCKSRIAEQLQQFGLWRDDAAWQEAWDRRVEVVEGDVILPRLGIADAAYEALAREVDCVIHSAAQVNFIYPYEALKATNVLGLHEVIRLALHARIKPVHFISTAAIWPMGSELSFSEGDPLDHGRLLNLGYDETKWVAEQCLVNAGERGLPAARYRPGEVGGDSQTGRCVESHFIFALLKGFLQFGAFPAIDTEVDMTPVDYVARALVHLACFRNPLGRAFHLTNPGRWHLAEILAFLRRLGYRLEELPFGELRDRLLQDSGFAGNALFPYQAVLEEMDDRSFQMPRYDCTQAMREIEGSGIACTPLDEHLLGTYVRYLRGIGYLPEPAGGPAAMSSASA